MEDVKTEGYLSKVDERPQLAQACFSEKAEKEEDAPKVGTEVSECNALETTEGSSILNLKDMLRRAKDCQPCEGKESLGQGDEVLGSGREGQVPATPPY
jgi:hypothetical protein